MLIYSEKATKRWCNLSVGFAITYELFILFSFFVLAYEVTKILCNCLFTFSLLFHFLNFRLACLVLQDAKTEHMEMKILKSIFGILVAWRKTNLQKYVMSRA